MTIIISGSNTTWAGGQR